MQYATDGGKRVRPLLGLSVARMFSANPAHNLNRICAVELVHCASLVIDDLPCMDNHATRREKRAAHREFGEAVSVLTAFALLTLAVRLSQPNANDRSETSSVSFQQALLDAIATDGLIAGQELDLVSRKMVGSDRPKKTCGELKTAPLFELACRAGLPSGPLKEFCYLRLLDFGRVLGKLYQSVDDMIDGEAGAANIAEPLTACRANLGELQSLGLDTSSLFTFVDWIATKVPALV